MVPWLVIDRRHLPRTPRGPRHRLSPVYPERPVQRARTPGLHLSGVQIEAQPQLWDADSNVLGVLTAVLPFTNHSPLTCSEPVGAAAHFSFKPFTCNTYCLPAIVANKTLTASLTPFSPTATKNTPPRSSPP